MDLEQVMYAALPHLERKWVCYVVRSGYHNGARCSADDPHDAWGCGWRHELHISLTDEMLDLMKQNERQS